MKPQTNYIFMALCLAMLSGPPRGRAATIWTGPSTTFVNTAGSDPTQAVNQDRLTADVWITRATTLGIYNAATESGFAHLFSPQNTAWSDGTLANYASLAYVDWDIWAKVQHGGPPNTVGVSAVVHLVSDDIYLSVTFTSWGGSAGGFSYVRSTPAMANQPPTVAITSPTNGASFTSPANVPITANASDPDGSVTNVPFFDGSTFLGETNNTPYTVTATLATGSHALTAVVTDNLGLSATSVVVTVTVSVANVPPSVTITNPPDNSTFGNTDTITIGASASDTDGSVTNVQFFDGLLSLGNRTTSPYTVSIGAFGFALGLHTVTAVASDNLGATATSAPMHVTIARYTPEVTNGAFSLFLVTVATNLAAPDYGISPPGDTHRLFVVEQNGLLRIIQDGVLLPTPALDIQSRVQPPLVASNPTDERGFLGLAFHPGFNNPASPGYQTLYTYNSEMIPTNTLPTYPVPTTASNLYMNVINEWKISSTNANVVDPSSRRAIISFGVRA